MPAEVFYAGICIYVIETIETVESLVFIDMIADKKCVSISRTMAHY